MKSVDYFSSSTLFTTFLNVSIRLLISHNPSHVNTFSAIHNVHKMSKSMLPFYVKSFPVIRAENRQLRMCEKCRSDRTDIDERSALICSFIRLLCVFSILPLG